MFRTFLKGHLKTDCVSRKEHVCYNAVNIELDLVQHKIIRGIMYEQTRNMSLIIIETDDILKLCIDCL
jgi:hypothetical protein